MPIRPEERARYPSNWKEISWRIRNERAKNKCEFCGADNGQPHPVTGSIVVLTCAHLDHAPENVDDSNLKALCQKCHFAWDQKHHAETKHNRKALGDLFDGLR